MGRAAMDHPCLFWDVDRYFYGEAHNPVGTRRNLLERYCAYLERIYPRRCCDRDERKTNRFPTSPEDTVFERYRDFCRICQHVYDPTVSAKDGKVSETESLPTLAEGDTDDDSLKPREEVKITFHIVHRSIKPTLGVFFNVPGQKSFRRQIDRLTRDIVFRNCGPGFILRTAMKCMPDQVLDESFVRTEEFA